MHLWLVHVRLFNNNWQKLNLFLYEDTVKDIVVTFCKLLLPFLPCIMLFAFFIHFLVHSFLFIFSCSLYIYIVYRYISSVSIILTSNKLSNTLGYVTNRLMPSIPLTYLNRIKKVLSQFSNNDIFIIYPLNTIFCSFQPQLISVSVVKVVTYPICFRIKVPYCNHTVCLLTLSLTQDNCT